MKCRFCNNKLTIPFIDMVNSPPSNSYLTKEELNEPEIFYPLKVFVCDKCFLVQIDEYKKCDEIFSEDYIYFSSYSSSLLKHSEDYTKMVIERFLLNTSSKVIEIASNDGYLLQYFKKEKIPCLGIEPSKKTAAVAKEKGIKVIEKRFSTSLAKELVEENINADLLIGNNVLAHVPNIKDFINGFKLILNQNGIITMEFTHLMKLVDNNLFDTIYHEHFSYLSLFTVKAIFEEFGLKIFDVEEIPTQGGSLRIFATHSTNNNYPISKRVDDLYQREISKNMNNIDYYKDFQKKANYAKYKLLEFLVQQKMERKKVIGYGAAAKGNTLLNYCGVKKDLIQFIVDKSPYKQNKYMPASHIPIVNESEIKKYKPDYILILPWNIKEEIMKQLDYVNDWNCKFVIPIPEVQIL